MQLNCSCLYAVMPVCCYYGDRIKVEMMDDACSSHGIDEECIQCFGQET